MKKKEKEKISTGKRRKSYLLRKENIIAATTLMMVYKDCRKNHAANIGRYAVDGCCEFMPAGDAGRPGAFLCAACNCHRNFHRKVITGGHDPSSFDCSSMTTTPK